MLVGTRIAGVDLNVDARVAVMEIVQARREELASEEGRHDDMQLPPCIRARSAEHRGLQCRKRGLEVVEQLATRRGERDRSGTSLEERHAQLLFELLDLMADGGRCEGKPLRRGLEARVLPREVERP